MINVRSNRAKRQLLFYMDRQMSAIERTFEKQLAHALHKQYKLVANLLEVGSRDFEHALHQTTPMIKEILSRYYKRIYLLFGNMIFDQIKDQSKSFGIIETKSEEDDFYDSMESWVKDHLGITLVLLHGATKSKIGKIILEMTESGATNKEIATEILATSTAITPARAMMISRTETHSVAIKATDTAMESTGLNYTKVWQAAMDLRTREDHALADEQEIESDAMYYVGGEYLEYPGDPNGSPWNIINCRCVERFNTIR